MPSKTTPATVPASGSKPAAPALPTGISPYLMFGGRCEEALEFYKKAVGAQVEMIMHFNQSPEPAPAGFLPPGFENKVMHATFKMAGSTLFASDGCEVGTHFKGFSLSYAVATPAEAQRVFAALSDGGKVTMPLAQTFYSPQFGMLEDRFGIAWMIITV